MTIESDIRTQSLTDSDVTDIIVARFYVGHIFSEVTFPAVQMRSIGGPLITHTTGEASLQNRNFQFDCYAKEESTAADLARKVRISLTGQFAAFSGVGIGQPVALYEEEHRAHRLTFDMSFWYY